jgi:hypothetical protein
VPNRAHFPTASSIILVWMFLVVAACGRTGIDDSVFSDDGGLEATVDVITPPPDATGCNAGTCPAGCCDANGRCQSGGSTSACGSLGQMCQDCLASGFQSCDATRHACNSVVGQCNTTNCGGCCIGNVCFAGSDPNECGSRGQACQPCASSGLACVGQQCTPPPACGTANCPGCCVGGQCLSGTAQTACGQRGGQCTNCAATGAMCVSSGAVGGACTQPKCNSNSCPFGCCDANGTCQRGASPAACGGGGASCRNCLPLGEQCLAQQCAPPPSCGPQNCSGCCDPTGNCVTGIFDNQCGGFGGSCSNCEQFGYKCSGSRQCVPPPPLCTPQTCPFGCCDAQGLCQSGFSVTQCGNFSNFCQNCLPFGEQCSNQQCVFVPDGGGCSAQTCPFGCCDGFGNCQSGFADGQCGNFGGFCQNCLQFGELCSNQQCIFVPDAGVCDGQTCPLGCCDGLGKCQLGSASTVCGNFGNSCENCSQFGEQCSNQQCVFGTDAGACNAQTCPSGCCDSSGQCQQGLTGTACGNFGIDCQNCLQAGEQCSNQQCLGPDGGSCNAQTCPLGCCDAAGNCQQGFGDTQCGNSGSLCLDCQTLGDRCLGQRCTSPEGGSPCSQSCAGCCDANGNCQAGFVDTQCGETGRTCQDCTMLNPPSTCDANVFPRGCTSQQMQCPGPYASCPAGLREPVPVPKKVCSATELQNAAAACSGGANTAACGSFINFESSANPACANCLLPFDVDFVAQSGVLACVAPYVDATCNHSSACVVDCTNQSCFGCLDSTSTSQCDSQVQSGVCSTYAQANQCAVQALGGPAAVCNPTTYQGNFGAWLQGVGAKYCGQ